MIDKGDAIVIMDKDDYILACEDVLSNKDFMKKINRHTYYRKKR